MEWPGCDISENPTAVFWILIGIGEVLVTTGLYKHAIVSIVTAHVVADL